MDSGVDWSSTLVFFRKLLRNHNLNPNFSRDPRGDESRRMLVSSVRTILCSIHPRKKFRHDIFEKIITRNAGARSFDPLEGSEAFDILRLYILTLYFFPWKKEYRTVKLYSGFFKTMVAAKLSEAVSVLRLVGYEEDRESVLVLRGRPPKPELLESVAFECLVASVECRLIAELAQEGECATNYANVAVLAAPRISRDPDCWKIRGADSFEKQKGPPVVPALGEDRSQQHYWHRQVAHPYVYESKLVASTTTRSSSSSDEGGDLLEGGLEKLSVTTTTTKSADCLDRRSGSRKYLSSDIFWPRRMVLGKSSSTFPSDKSKHFPKY